VYSTTGAVDDCDISVNIRDDEFTDDCDELEANFDNISECSDESCNLAMNFDNSSDEISETENLNPVIEALRLRLANWACHENISAIAVDSLLKILQEFHPGLPVDSRTLRSTPRTQVIHKLPGGGEYIHFGLEAGLRRLICRDSIVPYDGREQNMSLQFNIDGLPLFKSSKMCLWPILCIVRESTIKEPFVVGAY